MSKDEADNLAEIKASLKRIEVAVMGDKDAGIYGLAKRSDNHGQRIRSLERWRTYLLGASGAIVLGWAIYTQWPRK